MRNRSRKMAGNEKDGVKSAEFAVTTKFKEGWALQSTMTLKNLKPCDSEENDETRNIRCVSWMKLGEDNNDRVIFILLNICL